MAKRLAICNVSPKLIFWALKPCSPKERSSLIVPNRQDDKREAALKRLAALRGKMIVGDILEPLNEEWTGDANNV